MKEAMYQHGFQLLSEVSHDEGVQLYSAVVGKSGKILNIGNYLTFDNDGEVKILNMQEHTLNYTHECIDTVWPA